MAQGWQNVAELKRYQRSVSVTPGGVSTAQAQGYQSLANRLKSFANQQHAYADKEAALQGERSGQSEASGKTSGVTMQSQDTIRGRAFNKGAMMAHAAQIQIEVRDKVSEFARNNPYDVAGFDSGVQGFSAGLLSEIDPILKPHAENEINTYVSRARNGIQDNVYKQQTSKNLGIITTAVTGMKEDVLQAARSGDYELQDIKFSQIAAVYDEGVNDGVLDPNNIAKDIAVFSEQIDEQVQLGVFDKLLNDGDPKKVQEELDKFVKSKNKKLLPGTKDSIVSSVQGKINKLVTAKKTTLLLRTKKSKSDLDDFNSVVDQGHLPDAEALDLALINAKDTEHYDDLVGLKTFTLNYTPFIAQTAESQANAIAKAKAQKNMSAADVKVWERLEKIHNNTIEEAKTNGLELYFKQGLNDGEALPAINFGLLSSTKIVDGKEVEKTQEEKQEAQQLLIQQFAQNLAFADRASTHYGVKVPPLTQTQAKALLHSIKEGTRDEVKSTMAILTSGFGKNTADAMEAVFGDDNTAYAAIGGLVLTNTPHSQDVATNMLKGIDTIKNNANIIAKDFHVTAATQIGNTYADFPEHRETVINGAKALYAQYMVDAGNYGVLGTADNVTNADILEKALKDFTGGYANIQSDGTAFFGDDMYRIELPDSSTDADEVEVWMKHLRVEDIDAMGGVKDMESADAVELINLGYVKLVSMGDGRYAVKTGRMASAVMLDPKTSEPFVLDYRIGRKYDPGLILDTETEKSKIENKSKVDDTSSESSNVGDKIVDVIDYVSDAVMGVANALDDATVGNLADMIYDEETNQNVEKIKKIKKESVRQKRYKKRSNRKKK